MKIHELIDSMPPVQRGQSLTESVTPPAGKAGREILMEALSNPPKPSAELLPRKRRLKEFLALSKTVQSHPTI